MAQDEAHAPTEDAEVAVQPERLGEEATENRDVTKCHQNASPLKREDILYKRTYFSTATKS